MRVRTLTRIISILWPANFKAIFILMTYWNVPWCREEGPYNSAIRKAWSSVGAKSRKQLTDGETGSFLRSSATSPRNGDERSRKLTSTRWSIQSWVLLVAAGENRDHWPMQNKWPTPLSTTWTHSGCWDSESILSDCRKPVTSWWLIGYRTGAPIFGSATRISFWCCQSTFSFASSRKTFSGVPVLGVPAESAIPTS